MENEQAITITGFGNSKKVTIYGNHKLHWVIAVKKFLEGQGAEVKIKSINDLLTPLDKAIIKVKKDAMESSRIRFDFRTD